MLWYNLWYGGIIVWSEYSEPVVFDECYTEGRKNKPDNQHQELMTGQNQDQELRTKTWQEIFNFLHFAILLAFRGLDNKPNSLTFLFFLFSALV